MRHVCLRNPFLPFLFGIATIQPLPEATALCLSLHCSFRKKPVPCREAEGLVTELWSPRYVTILWLCSQLCYETAANQRTLVQIELLATVSWKWGCRPFSCRCSQNVPHCRKEICSTCSFKESIPTIPCVNSKHPIPARSLRFFLRAAACSTGSALWLHHAHPFVVTAEKACLMQRSGAASLSATYVPKMWRTAEKRWTRHLCLPNPCFCGNLSLHSV